MKIDADEKELLESVERREWKSAGTWLLRSEGSERVRAYRQLHKHAAGRLKEI